MPNQPISILPEKTRKHSAEEINRAMARFPLILRILGELRNAQLPFPGDSDIRHGCERALTSLLSELAYIPKAPVGKSSKAEETAQAWLQNPAANELINADVLERMQQFIDAILNPSKNS